MLRKYFLYILVSLLGVFGICWSILALSDLPNKKANGFMRVYKSKVNNPLAISVLSEGITRISGLTNSSIYFSGRSPQWVISSSLYLSEIDTMYFGVLQSDKLRDPNIYIDSPNVYMYANDVSYLLLGRIGAIKLDTLKLKTDLITRTAQLSENKIAIRGIDSTQTRQVFKVIDAKSGEVIHQNDIIKMQQFGGFDVDGVFRYDKLRKNLFYVEMFSNRLYCMDTNLNLQYLSHTIDTTNTNTVTIGMQDESGITKVMATKPRQVVNKFMDVNDDLIYIVSGMRADNESLKDFNSYVSIDVYNQLKGNYSYSFTIPKLHSKKLLDFKVRNNLLFAVYEGGVCATFELKN